MFYHFSPVAIAALGILVLLSLLVVLYYFAQGNPPQDPLFYGKWKITAIKFSSNYSVLCKLVSTFISCLNDFNHQPIPFPPDLYCHCLSLTAISFLYHQSFCSQALYEGTYPLLLLDMHAPWVVQTLVASRKEHVCSEGKPGMCFFI